VQVEEGLRTRRVSYCCCFQVRGETHLTALPSIRRRGMHVEEP
jgi:hypothetical protein